MKQTLLLASLSALGGNSFAAESGPQMLVPGFVVRELPLIEP